MKKLLIYIVLIELVLISGCTSGQQIRENGETTYPTNAIVASSTSNINTSDESETKSEIQRLFGLNVAGMHEFFEIYRKGDVLFQPDIIIKRFPDKNATDPYIKEYFLVEVGITNSNQDFNLWNTYLVKEDYSYILVIKNESQLIEAWREKEFLSSINLGTLKIAKSVLSGNEVFGLFSNGACIENNIYDYVVKNKYIYVYGQTGYTVINLENEAIKQLIIWDNAPVYYYRDFLPNYKGILAFTEFSEEEQFNLKSFEYKEVILKKANHIGNAIQSEDMEQLSEYVHPEKGLRFSHFGSVVVKDDIVVSKEELKDFFTKDYTIIYYDEDDDMPQNKESGYTYFKEKIYFSDYTQALIGYDKNVELEYYPVGPGNQFEIYNDSIMVELYFNNNSPEIPDWRIIRFIFQLYKNDWYLVGIISDEWTP